jgi:hypothetical protein
VSAGRWQGRRRSCAGLVLLALSGCASIGPGTVSRDRVGYLAAVGESWKEQTLLNIVRLRYGDAPTFLEVSSIISGYGLQGQVSAGGQVSSDRTNTIPSSLATFGAVGTYLDRPTISYTPLSGQKFTTSLLRPIPPSAIFELIQAGYPADFILLVTTRAVNGVFNRSSMGGVSRGADAAFYPLLDTLRRLQLSGAVSLRREKRGPEEIVHLVLSGSRSADVDRDLRAVRDALGARPGAQGEMTLAFGAVPRGENEIAVLSRSMMEILLEIALGIDVPVDHVTQGRTAASARAIEAADARDRPLVRVLAGPERPADAFAAVRHRDTWYWIDDRDYRSKRVLSVLMLFFSLAETGVAPQAPLLTLPAN